jgi:hypothetical protein
VFPWDLKKPYINQWNVSIQRQLGTDWLITGNYMGSNIIHMLYRYEANPAVYDPRASCVIAGRTFTPCSTVASTNQRRVLYTANPAVGQYYANIAYGDDGATRTYNAMILQLQRRRAKGITIQGNYTWSHGIDDGYNDVIQNNGGQVQERRGANRGNSELDRRHNFNMSAVYDTPQFSNSTLHVLAANWQISGSVRILSGPFLAITSGIDNAFTATSDQGPNQVLASVYPEKKTMAQWFNAAAFAQPAVGTYGNVGAKTVGGNYLGPGSVQINMGLTRKFAVRENQTLEFRAEVLNVPNHVNPNPVDLNTTLSNASFGQILSARDPRIMQMALKYVF